jgi:subfamily B ATP-binding cassette protein MsbA
MAGSLTPGNLVTFLFYALQVGGTVAALTGIFNQFQEALGASGRIFELLDERSDLPQPAQPAPLAATAGAVGGFGFVRAVGRDCPAAPLSPLPSPFLCMLSPARFGCYN